LLINICISPIGRKTHASTLWIIAVGLFYHQDPLESNGINIPNLHAGNMSHFVTCKKMEKRNGESSALNCDRLFVENIVLFITVHMQEC